MLDSARRLGPYEIIAPLGIGGMGEVYRARDTRLGRDVAVKVLAERFADSAELRTRFEREARAVAALSHPNILAIHDYGTEGSSTYAVMELLEGQTLRARLAQGALAWRKAIEIAVAVAEGLSAAHAKGITHRDLKPENLFLLNGGSVKILDFGLAQVQPLAGGLDETSPHLPRATEAGTVLGTVGHMAPEQVRGQAADVRSDIFSLGCVLYEMVTGQRAFARETAVETMTAILHDEPPELSESGKKAPLELERVIRHCLEKHPAERFQSAHDLAFALRALVSDSRLPMASLPSGRASFVPWLVTIAVLALAACLVYFSQKSTAAVLPVDAIAVLPFVNESNDPEAEHLSDGIPESIVHILYEARGLTVRPFGSTSRYRAQLKNLDLKEVAQKLNVQAIVTGKLKQRKDRLLLSAELVDARDNKGLWFGSYDRQQQDIQAIQDEIAQQICGKLGIRLTREEQKRLVKRATDNSEAYQLYLKGRYYWNKRTVEALNRGIGFFRQALDRDPNFALAHVGIADCYVLLPSRTPPRDPKEVFPLAQAHVLKALELDDALAEAHATLGFIKHHFEWDWARAESEYRQAIDLNPGYATAHHWYGIHLSSMGRLEEAIACYRRALELDPLSLIINTALAGALMRAGREQEANERVRSVLEMDRNFAPALWHAVDRNAHQGRYAEALQELEKVRERIDDKSARLADAGYYHAKLGNVNEARQVLEELHELSRRQYVSPYPFAVIHLGLGEIDETFTWLDKAYEARANGLLGIHVNPTFAHLHDDPRFQDLLRRMGLTDKAAKQGIQSVAVLPFENVSGDPKSEYLSDGLADQTIESLSQVRSHNLKVRPFSSVSRYRGQKVNPIALGRELNVQAVVTGTLHLQGENLWISVELVDAQQDNRLWGKRYQGKLDGILGLQDQIAREVAANLQLRLTGEDERRLTKHYTEDADAYLLYREGQYHWSKFSPEGLKMAEEYFRRAAQKDPNYALAYAGLGRNYILLGTLIRGPRETFPEARKYIDQALAIDDSLAEAHYGLGTIYLFGDWNWPAAEREFKRALSLDAETPSQTLYGFYLAAMGRPNDALPYMKRSKELAPGVAQKCCELAMGYNWMRQHDLAVTESQAAIALNPNFFHAYRELGLAYSQKGMHAAAESTLRKGMELGEDTPQLQGMLGYVYAVSGKRAEAREILDQLTDAAQRRYGAASAIARIHVGLGEHDQALMWLQKAGEERNAAAIWLKVDPTLDNLRADSRFAQILSDMGLPSQELERKN